MRPQTVADALRQLLCAVWMLWALTAAAGKPAAAEQPAEVAVGIYVNNIQEVSFKDGKVTVDFYVWFRWKAEGPLETYAPLTSMEVINGAMDDGSKGSVVTRPKPGTVSSDRYASQRVRATIYNPWPIENFPFDAHSIEIRLEDSDFNAQQLRFVPDTVMRLVDERGNPVEHATDKTRPAPFHASLVGKEARVAGWTFPFSRIKVTAQEYATGFGEPDLHGANAAYSRVIFEIAMRRSGSWLLAIKLLITPLIAVLVACVAFGIDPEDVDPRFGLGVGSLFAVAASAVVLASTVPDSSVFTIADQFHLLAMVFIFASLVQSALCLKWAEAKDERLHALYKRVDVVSLVVFPLLFALASYWIMLPGLRELELEGPCVDRTQHQCVH